MRGAWVVLDREVDRLSRRPWFYAVRGAILASLLLLLAAMGLSPGADRLLTFEQRAVLGRLLYHSFHVGVVLLLLLLVPAVVSGAVVVERQRGTAEVLYTTPLSSAGVLAGLAGGRLLLLAAFLVSAVPALAASVAIGGVTGSDIGLSLVRIGVLSVWLVSLCLLVSTLAGRVAQAIRISYALLSGLAFLPLVEMGIRMILRPAGAPPAPVTLATQPLIWAIWPDDRSWGPVAPRPSVFLAEAAAALVVSVLLARRMLLRRVATGRIAQRRPRPPPRGDVILWMDRIHLSRRRLRWLAYLGWLSLLAGVAVCGLGVLLGGNRREVGIAAAATLSAGLLILEALVLIGRVGPAFRREADAGRMELLLCSGLPRTRLLLGSVAAALRRCLPLLVLHALVVLVAVAGNPDCWAAIPLASMAVPGCLLFVVGLSALSAAICRTAAGSFLLPVAVCLGVLAGIPLLLAAWEVLFGLRHFPELLIGGHPLVAVTLPLVEDRLQTVGAGIVLGSLVWAATGGGLLALALARFRRAPASRWLGGPGR